MDDKKTMINDMTRGNLASQIIRFSLPFVLGNLLQTLYTIVDMVVVGQFVGSAGLSAVSISGQITMLMYAIGIGFGNGSQILVSQQVGSGDREGLKKTIGTTLTAIMAVSIVVTVIGILFSEAFLQLLNTPAESMPQAVSYMIICCCGVPFTYAYGNLSDLLRGMGDSKRPLYFIAISSVINVVLDLVFVAGLKMEAAGAALATVISQLLSAVFAYVYLYRRREAFGFDFKLRSFKMDRHILGIVTRLSIPLVMMTACINISMIFITAYVNVYGVAASAASGVGGKLNSIANVVTGAMQVAAGTVIGQNMGAGRHDRVSKTMYITWGISLAFSAVICVVSVLFPKAVFGMFTSDAAVLGYAPAYMRIAVWTFISFALMSSPLGLINGVGFPALNFVIAILDGVAARIGLSLLFGIAMGMGLEGFWWGNSVAGYVSVILGSLYFFSGRWKKRKILA